MTEGWDAFPGRPRFIVHGGTPKTGTTALQDHLYGHRAVLERHGIWYPPPDPNVRSPKHQQVVRAMRAGDPASFIETIGAFVRGMPADTHTVFVSAEGIYNHWWDLQPEVKAALGAFAARFEVELWMCFRDPQDFALSLYVQSVRNVYDSPINRLDATLEQMLELDAFTRNLDYDGFLRDARVVFGEDRVRLFHYGPDIVERIVAALGVDLPGAAARDANASLREPGLAMQRIVNRYPLTIEVRAKANALIREIDGLFRDAAEPVRPSEAAARRIRALTLTGWTAVQAAIARSEAGEPRGAV